jgi:Spy/CpxP family protein refolding chaperone
MKYLPLMILIAGIPFASEAMQESAYSGQEQRTIKSLSQDEIDGYLAGNGMGFAKAAELNHYPGPKHVLELAGELELTDSQRQETQQIFDAMKVKAIEYGQLLVKNEQEIEKLFAEGRANKRALENALKRSAEIRSALRGVHLMAHIEQKSILNADQLAQYDKFRGYAGSHEHKGH